MSALPIAVAEALFANSHAGIAVFAGDTGECLLANEMMAKLAGGSVEELGLHNFRTLVSWRDSGLTDAAEATLADGVLRHHETTMHTSFGKEVTLDSSLSLFDFEGKPHLMLIASDVTERRRAEQALAVREQELRTLVDTVPDLIVRYDRELRRTYVNPAWEQASGLSARDVIDVPAAAIPNVPKPVHDEYMQKLRQVLETGAPQKTGFTWVNAFGTELYLEYVIVPEHDRSGAITGVLAIGRDITERKRMEEALQIQTIELEEEVAERQMTQENLQEKALQLEEEIEKRQQIQDNLEKLNEELEQRVQWRTGELAESQQALINLVEDLNLKSDEMESANIRLKELGRLKSMFIASMSHELRTPLNSIIGFSSILHDEWLGPVNPEQKENLETIKRSGKHLLNLINDVIDVSKIEAGRIETNIEEFDLYDLLMEAVQYVEKDLRDKGLDLRLDIDHHTICTDKRRLLQCVINLLSNAVKFTEQGMVTVSTDTPQDDGSGRPPIPLSISVSDTGIGIAAEDIRRLFQPFVRLETPMKSTVPGTGLGLYLTKKLVVDVLGGDILCRSESGTGSSFTLKIPERIYEKGAGNRG